MAPTDANHSNDRGDLLIRGLHSNGTDTIIDFQVTHLDAPSYQHRDPLTVLQDHEKAKSHKYERSCAFQRRKFLPFIASTDGMLSPQAKQLLQQLSHVLSKKWSMPYSTVCHYVNSRVSLALVRSTFLCLRGSRIPLNAMSAPRYQYDEAEGIYRLLQH